jgi:hypothetical protein
MRTMPCGEQPYRPQFPPGSGNASEITRTGNAFSARNAETKETPEIEKAAEETADGKKEKRKLNASRSLGMPAAAERASRASGAVRVSKTK